MCPRSFWRGPVGLGSMSVEAVSRIRTIPLGHPAASACSSATTTFKAAFEEPWSVRKPRQEGKNNVLNRHRKVPTASPAPSREPWLRELNAIGTTVGHRPRVGHHRPLSEYRPWASSMTTRCLVGFSSARSSRWSCLGRTLRTRSASTSQS